MLILRSIQNYYVKPLYPGQSIKLESKNNSNSWCRTLTSLGESTYIVPNKLGNAQKYLLGNLSGNHKNHIGILYLHICQIGVPSCCDLMKTSDCKYHTQTYSLANMAHTYMVSPHVLPVYGVSVDQLLPLSSHIYHIMCCVSCFCDLCLFSSTALFQNAHTNHI